MVRRVGRQRVIQFRVTSPYRLASRQFARLNWYRSVVLVLIAGCCQSVEPTADQGSPRHSPNRALTVEEAWAQARSGDVNAAIEESLAETLGDDVDQLLMRCLQSPSIAVRAAGARIGYFAVTIGQRGDNLVSTICEFASDEDLLIRRVGFASLRQLLIESMIDVRLGHFPELENPASLPDAEAQNPTNSNSPVPPPCARGWLGPLGSMRLAGKASILRRMREIVAAERDSELRFEYAKAIAEHGKVADLRWLVEFLFPGIMYSTGRASTGAQKDEAVQLLRGRTGRDSRRFDDWELWLDQAQ